MAKYLIFSFFIIFYSCSSSRKNEGIEVNPDGSPIISRKSENIQKKLESSTGQIKKGIEVNKNSNGEMREGIEATQGNEAEQEGEQIIPMKTYFLTTISTDYSRKTYDLLLVTAKDDKILGMHVRNNKKNRTKFYSNEILSSEMTLLKAAGIRLITLKCHKFSVDSGCTMIIEYPNNITYGSFRKFEAELRRDGESWALSKDGKKFTKLHMLSKTFLGLLIGIKKIEIN